MGIERKLVITDEMAWGYLNTDIHHFATVLKKILGDQVRLEWQNEHIAIFYIGKTGLPQDLFAQIIAHQSTCDKIYVQEDNNCTLEEYFDYEVSF